MRIVIVALIALAVAGTHGAKLLNSDFENLKNQLIGTWSFMENGQSYEATFEAVSHGRALLERNSGLSRFIIPMVSTDCS